MNSVAFKTCLQPQMWLTEVYKATLYLMHYLKSLWTFIYCLSNDDNQWGKKIVNSSAWHHWLLLDKSHWWMPCFLMPGLKYQASHLNSGKCVYGFGFHLFVRQPFYFSTVMSRREIKITLPPHQCYSTTSICLISLKGFPSSKSAQNSFSSSTL